MTEVVFHWCMVAYYLYADLIGIKGLKDAHTLRGTAPDDRTTNRMVNGTLTYITIWNMLVQQLYFILCCREHLLSMSTDWKRRKESCGKTRHLILHSILFPTTCVVAMVYWCIYWRSPTLIFGDILGEIYPPWMDHTMHTFIVPIAFFELYLSSTRESAKVDTGRIKGWLAFNAFLTFYTTTVIIAHLIRGVWPYPFLDPANNGSPSLFFLFLYVAGGVWYYVGQHLTHNIWGNCSDGRKKEKRL